MGFVHVVAIPTDVPLTRSVVATRSRWRGSSGVDVDAGDAAAAAAAIGAGAAAAHRWVRRAAPSRTQTKEQFSSRTRAEARYRLAAEVACEGLERAGAIAGARNQSLNAGPVLITMFAVLEDIVSNG